jgi:uncharacterized protein YbjQ (UPF0145 family)
LRTLEVAVFTSKTTLIALVLVLGSASRGFARDDIENYSIKHALETADAREKLDPKIKLFFGNWKHGAVVKSIGEWKSYKKTNGVGRANEIACQRAFLSAAISLQQRASKMGGNAVIGIKSDYDNMKTSSDTTYVCGSGLLMSAVALIGTVVRVEK